MPMAFSPLGGLSCPHKKKKKVLLAIDKLREKKSDQTFPQLLFSYKKQKHVP